MRFLVKCYSFLDKHVSAVACVCVCCVCVRVCTSPSPLSAIEKRREEGGGTPLDIKKRIETFKKKGGREEAVKNRCLY